MRTKTRTIYPELINTNVANSSDMVTKYTTFLESIQGNQSNAVYSKDLGIKYPASTGIKYNADGSYQIPVRVTAYSRTETPITYDPNTPLGIAARPNQNGNFNLIPNSSIAVDKSIINYGSTINLPGLPYNYYAHDTGEGLKGNWAAKRSGQNVATTVDVFFDTKEEQNAFVRQYNKQFPGGVVYATVYPPGASPSLPNTIKPTLAATPTTPSPGDLKKQLDLSMEYWKAKKSSDPINNLANFFNGLNSKLRDFNNDFVFYWYKKLQAQPDDVKAQVQIDENSLLAEPSDSVGHLTNTLSQFSEYVSPAFDVQLDYGPPQTVPTSVQNKLPQGTLELSYDLSSANAQLMKTNQVSVQKVNDTYNIATDSTQPHGLNLVSDIPSYQQSYNAQAGSLECLTNKFGRDRFEYLNYFSSMNDNPAYNPADTTINNLQSMPNISYQMNVENTSQSVDILKKKNINSMNYRTIKGALACRSKTRSNGVTTAESNRALLYQTRTVQLTTPISLSQKATARLAAAQQALQLPNAQISSLINRVNQTGIGNLPFTESLLMPLYNLQGLAGGVVGGFSSSLGNIQSIAQSPLSNLPNVLPSMDPGSFPQIFSLLTNSNFSNLNAQSIFGSAQQLKGIICDFKLPVLGRINFDGLVNKDITGDFENTLKNLLPKIPKIDDFKNALKGLVPDFKSIWDGFYKSFFECENKDDFN
jgi:3D (Asp-Asp-Asp) domain-containing protein